jgi:hypothetical protein
VPWSTRSAPLSRTIISQSYAATVLADGPAVFLSRTTTMHFRTAVQRPSGGQSAITYQADRIEVGVG